jgi:hypothetical protein
MAGREGFMGFLVSNLSVLWSTGGNQDLEWEIMVEHPQTFKCFLIIKYVRSASFIVYGLGLWRLQCFPLDENCFFVFWFTPVKSMAPIVRIEPNGLQTLLSHDDAMGRLSQVDWLGFIQSFDGFNLEVAKEFSRTFDGTKAKIGDVQLQSLRNSLLRQRVFLRKVTSGLKI